MPAPLTRTLKSNPDSEAFASEQYSGTAVEDTPSSDGGACVELRRCLQAGSYRQ